MTIEVTQEKITRPHGAAEILLSEKAKEEAKASKPATVQLPQFAKLTLIEKLLHIEQEMPDIEKTGHNENQNYDFVEQKTIMNAVRPLLQSYGVLVIPRVTGHTLQNKQGWNIKANATTEMGVKAVVSMVFTFVNVHKPDDKLDIPWTAEGDDYGDKGTNKATTIAQKNMYIRLFNIADSDPDADTPAGGSVAAPAKTITAQKETMIYRMLKAVDLTVESYEAGLKKPVTKMTNEEADQAILKFQAAIERKRASENLVA